MKKILFASLTALFLTACGGENTEQFIGTWAEQNATRTQAILVITEDSDSKVNLQLKMGKSSINATYLVQGNKLIEPMDKQTTYVLKDGLMTNTIDKSVFKKE